MHFQVLPCGTTGFIQTSREGLVKLKCMMGKVVAVISFQATVALFFKQGKHSAGSWETGGGWWIGKIEHI